MRIGALCVALGLTASVLIVGASSGQELQPGGTEGKGAPFVVFLGTGTPGPTPNRQGPALAVVAGGKAYLVDAGVGVVRQASAAYSNGVRALDPRGLGIAFVSHLHSDHTLGLPDLILTPWVMGRTAPLELYGPPGISAMAENILKAYAEDIHVRITGLEQANTTGYKVNAHEVKPGVVYQDANVKVTAFAVPHGSWPLALGFRFDAGGKSIVYSGDTAPAESVVQACDGCDLLIHEVYLGLPASAAHSPEHWAQYMATFHTSAAQLADIATRAHAKTLVTTHLAFMANATEADLVEVLKKGYSGKVGVAHDLDVVTP
ncbi:MAG TPA: MBL fold metallo-hydrolase [Candidatus Acidoferrales bacterium]|nr:MBL fold metallo-hydrolase [Candidatus Acidoferrales bacterium]